MTVASGGDARPPPPVRHTSRGSPSPCLPPVSPAALCPGATLKSASRGLSGSLMTDRVRPRETKGGGQRGQRHFHPTPHHHSLLTEAGFSSGDSSDRVDPVRRIPFWPWASPALKHYFLPLPLWRGVVMASPGTPWGTRASLSPTHPQPVVHGHPSLGRILCLVAESFPLLSARPAPAPERTGSVRVIIGPQAQQSVWSTVGHQ